MRDFQKKRGWRNILQSWPVLAILAVFLVVFLAGVINFMSKMLVTIDNRKIVENKIRELEKDKEKLSSDIAKLNTKSGVEETIREKFGLAKEGEGMIVVMEDKNEAVEKDSSTGGFFSFFMNWFK